MLFLTTILGVRLLQMTRAEDIVAQIRTRPRGEDGTVLTEVRDLRRYLLLVEADMVAAGVVEVDRPPGDGPDDENLHAREKEEEPPRDAPYSFMSR